MAREFKAAVWMVMIFFVSFVLRVGVGVVSERESKGEISALTCERS